MVSLTKYAGTISQTTGGKYAQFSNLNNLKNNADNQWATTVTVKGKSGSPNRPSTISLSNFGMGLPTGAEVSKVIVTYRHRKTGGCTTSTKTFTGSALTRTVVNSSSFGVKVDYPSNSGTGEGTISVSYVRVTVEYKVPSYSLSLKKVNGGYNEEEYTLQCSISNKNMTSYSPTLTLVAPAGFSFKEASGSGSYTRVNARTITWNPSLSKSIGTATLDSTFEVDVVYPSGQSSYTGTFSLSESLYGTVKEYSTTITERPPEEQEETEPNAPLIIEDEEASIKNPEIHNVSVGEIFGVNINTSDWELDPEGAIYGMWAFKDPGFVKYDDFDMQLQKVGG